MTDLAIRDLGTRRDTILGSIRRAVISLLGRESDHHLPPEVVQAQQYRIRTATPQRRPQLKAVTNGQEHKHGPDARWARHPQLRSRQVDQVPRTGTRAARLEAERGLLLARSGKLVEAADAFTVAARDPRIDLSTLPGFWDLPRNGMLTAVRAYERTERLREAAALEARIRHLLRPRVIRPAPAKEGRLSASGD